jgi:hypothetical protein
MAAALTLAQTVAAYKKWHVPHRVYAGAGTRGRPGGLAPVGVAKHHTGGGSASASYLYFLFVTGRPEDGIPGPLCNEATDMGGTVHIGAVGRANHAGKGSAATRDHVQREDYAGYTTELRPGPDAVNGNAIYYGDEIIYSGTRPPTAAQYRASVLAAAARCDAHGWSALSVFAHREHTGRKLDPFGVSMAQMRRDVRDCLKVGPARCVQYIVTGKLLPAAPSAPKPPAPSDLTGDDMPWSEAQLRAMMQAENEEYAIRFWIDPSGTGYALRMLNQASKLQLDRIENALAQHTSNDLQPLALDAEGMSPETRELVTALHDSVNALGERPMAAQLQAFLNTDGTMDDVFVVTDAEAPREDLR